MVRVRKLSRAEEAQSAQVRKGGHRARRCGREAKGHAFCGLPAQHAASAAAAADQRTWLSGSGVPSGSTSSGILPCGLSSRYAGLFTPFVSQHLGCLHVYLPLKPLFVDHEPILRGVGEAGKGWRRGEMRAGEGNKGWEGACKRHASGLTRAGQHHVAPARWLPAPAPCPASRSTHPPAPRSC